MKKLLAFAVVALIGLAGCNNKSPVGGPGAVNQEEGPSLTQPDNTFQIKVPLTETTIKQGETKTVKIEISRGKNFDQDVKIDFGSAPKGITVTPVNGEIKASENEMTVNIEAAKNAALGHHTITMTGKPAKTGTPTSVDLKIEVQKID